MSVNPLSPAGQKARAFGFGAGTVVAPVDGAPGAVGSGPVVIVGAGAVGRFAGLLVTGSVPCGAPGPTVTDGVVARMTGVARSRAEFAATAAVVAIAVSIAMGAFVGLLSLLIMGVALFAIQAFFTNLPAIIHFVRTDLPAIGKALWGLLQQLFKAKK